MSRGILASGRDQRRIRLDLLPRLPAIQPLAILEVEVAAVADLEHRHSLGDVLEHLVLIIEVDGDPQFADLDSLLGEGARQGPVRRSGCDIAPRPPWPAPGRSGR